MKSKGYKESYESLSECETMVSECCNSLLIGENDGVSGRCSSCKENCLIQHIVELDFVERDCKTEDELYESERQDYFDTQEELSKGVGLQ